MSSGTAAVPVLKEVTVQCGWTAASQTVMTAISAGKAGISGEEKGHAVCAWTIKEASGSLVGTCG